MPNFTKGRTFTSTEELTNTKLHQLVEDASMNVTAITSLTALTDAVADTDTLPIADDSATAIRKVPASNFLRKNSSSVFDAGTTRITGVATPTGSTDATTKAYVDSIAVVAGNLPQVSNADNNSLLKVVSGSWTTTPNSEALNNSGVTAGTYGGATSTPQITVDAKGRITSAISFNTTPADLSPSPAGTYGSGSQVPVLTVNAKGQITSATTAAAGAAGGMFYENDITLNSNYTISTNKNAMTAGPITVANGVTVTVPSGSTWTIV